MFDWLFEKESVYIIQFYASSYHDWIHKLTEVFHVVNNHDTLKNKLLYGAYGLLRSGLFDEYLINRADYDEDRYLQFVTVKCWPKAMKDLKKIDWVCNISEVIEEA